MPVNTNGKPRTRADIEEQRAREFEQLGLTPPQALPPPAPPPPPKPAPEPEAEESAIKKAWRTVTPWSEDKETFPEYMKGYPGRLKDTIKDNLAPGKTPEAQSSLKADYDAYKNAPTWAKYVIPQDVFLDPRTGKYFRVREADAPLVGGKKLPKVAVKERVDWRGVERALERGAVKSARDAIRLDKKVRKDIIKPTDFRRNRAALNRLQGKKSPRQTTRKGAATDEIIARTLLARNIPKNIKASIIPEITLSASEIKALQASIPDSDALADLIEHQANIERKLNEGQTITNPEIVEQLKLLEDVTVKTSTQTEEATKTEPGTEFKTEAEAEEETQPQTKTRVTVSTKTETQTKGQTRTQTAPIKKTKTETKKTTAKTAAKATTTAKPPIKEKTPKKIPKIKPPFFNKEDDKKRRQEVLAADGAIAWRQGQLRGRDRWDVVMSPYTREENYTIVLGRKPSGAILIKGPGSAFRTARTIFGQRLRRSTVVNQPGLFATTLEPTGTDKIRLTFERDVTLSKRIGSLENKGRVFPLP